MVFGRLFSGTGNPCGFIYCINEDLQKEVSGAGLFDLSELIKNAHLFNIDFTGPVGVNNQKEIFMWIANEFLKP